MIKSHLLIVDDDCRLRDLLRRYLLQQEDFFVSTSASVAQAKKALETFVFDALIVDIMMPGGLGTELFSCFSLPPTILLSAMGEAHDRIHGLELGAHDYLIKPFEPKELMLRLRNVLKGSGKPLVLGDKNYCLRRRILKKHNQVIALSHAEGQLFHYLACRAHQILSRQEVAQQVFPQASNERVVDVQINRLRKKIEDNPEAPQYLVSLRGQGYCLKAT